MLQMELRFAYETISCKNASGELAHPISLFQNSHLVFHTPPVGVRPARDRHLQVPSASGKRDLCTDFLGQHGCSSSCSHGRSSESLVVSPGFRRLHGVETSEEDSDDDDGDGGVEQAGCKGNTMEPKDQGKVDGGLDGRMHGRGWIPCGDGRWQKYVKDSECMVDVAELGLKRKTTRDMATHQVLEDLSLQPTTPERIRQRAFNTPRDIKVVVDIGEGSPGGNVDDEDMSSADASRYRAAVARMNFLARVRADIQFVLKECSRRMARPRTSDWALLKQAVRYLKGYPRIVFSAGGSIHRCTSRSTRTATGPSARAAGTAPVELH